MELERADTVGQEPVAGQELVRKIWPVHRLVLKPRSQELVDRVGQMPVVEQERVHSLV